MKEKTLNIAILKNCDICGGMTVMIRGRYPGSMPRKVCPLCLADTLEDINIMSDQNYRVASNNAGKKSL